MLESKNFEDYLDDLKNVKNIIERSSSDGGLLLPYLDNDDQFKQLSEAVHRVSKSRNTFIKSLKNYIASDEYMNILTNTNRSKVQELRKHFYVAFQRGDTSLKKIVHSYPSFQQDLDFLLSQTKETLLKFFDDDFKAGRLLKKADKSLSKKDLCFHVYENWNYCTETDEELIEDIFLWEIQNIMIYDMGIEIKDLRTVLTKIINEEGNYSKSTQECGKILHGLATYHELEPLHGLGRTAEGKAIYRRFRDEAAEYINKRNLNLSIRPFEQQMRTYKNIPYHCSTPLEYFPLDDYVEKYQQHGYLDFRRSQFDKTSIEVIGATSAKIIDNRKRELSRKFYEKNAKDLQLISEIGKITKNKDIGNIDISNALNTCYQILKGYKYSACVHYAENCSRKDFFEGWFAYSNSDDRTHEHQLYKKYLVRDRHDFISSDLLKSNNHYGEIIDELKNQLGDELLNVNKDIDYTGTKFYGIMIGEIGTKNSHSLKQDNEIHAQINLANGLTKKLVTEIRKLSKKSFKKFSHLDDWLNFEFQGYYEEEVTRFEAIKKHIAKLEKQDMFNLIRTGREKLNIFKREEKKLNKSKNIIKKYLEDNTEKFKELIENVEEIESVWQIEESIEKFFEIFPKNLLNFGKGLSFFVGNDLDKLYKLSTEYEPYSESELQTLEDILNKIEPKLRLKDEDIYNQNSKLQTKIMKKNIKIAEKLLSIEEKSFLRTWVLQEGQLIYKDSYLIHLQDGFQGMSNIGLNKKNRNTLNKTMHHELPNYREIQRANNNVFNAIKDFYEVDENNEITDASINNIKNVIIDLLALLDLRPDMSGFIGNSLVDAIEKEWTKDDKNKDKLSSIFYNITNFITFKINTKCEVYISNCMDAITRAVLFLNGVNPFDLKTNPYDKLIEDLNAPIKLFEHYQKCETEYSSFHPHLNLELEPHSICQFIFIWQIVDSLKDLKEYLKLMKLLDIYDFQELPMIVDYDHVDSYILNRKMMGISNQELAILARKVSKHNVVNLKSLEQLINKYEKITPSSMTKFIRDNKNENTEKIIKELFNKKVKSTNLTKPQRKKLEKELLKHSLLHNITDKGLINRDSAIKWLRGQQGNHKKLKNLSTYKDAAFFSSFSLGFYEFAKITNWVGYSCDASDARKIVDQIEEGKLQSYFEIKMSERYLEKI